MVSCKLLGGGGDLEEPFNVGKNITRFQDAGLHKIIKLIRDFRLVFTHLCTP
jgi:hypothetical protein